MHYLKNSGDNSNTIHLRVINTFKKYKEWTEFVYKFIHLSKKITDNDNIKFTNIDQIQSKIDLENLLTVVMEKNTTDFSPISEKIKRAKDDINYLKYTVNGLIFTNFQNAKTYIEIFETNIYGKDISSSKSKLDSNENFNKAFQYIYMT